MNFFGIDKNNNFVFENRDEIEIYDYNGNLFYPWKESNDWFVGFDQKNNYVFEIRNKIYIYDLKGNYIDSFSASENYKIIDNEVFYDNFNNYIFDNSLKTNNNDVEIYLENGTLVDSFSVDSGKIKKFIKWMIVLNALTLKNHNGNSWSKRWR